MESYEASINSFGIGEYPKAVLELSRLELVFPEATLRVVAFFLLTVITEPISLCSKFWFSSSTNKMGPFAVSYF